MDIDTKNMAQTLTAIERVWNGINPDYPFQFQFITDVYQQVYSTEYAQVSLLLIFTIISIILSSLGVYAMSAFNMQRRVKEIGIRKVNGAKIWQVMLMLNSGIFRWIAIAFVIATPIGFYAMSRWLENFAYKTTLSWWVFVLAGLLSLLVALLNVSWQSWRAATRNPVEALRYE